MQLTTSAMPPPMNKCNPIVSSQVTTPVTTASRIAYHQDLNNNCDSSSSAAVNILSSTLPYPSLSSPATHITMSPNWHPNIKQQQPQPPPPPHHHHQSNKKVSRTKT